MAPKDNPQTRAETHLQINNAGKYGPANETILNVIYFSLINRLKEINFVEIQVLETQKKVLQK
jgi:hypothetical protein